MASIFKGEAYYRGNYRNPELSYDEIRRITFKLKGISKTPFNLQELSFLFGSISDYHWHSVQVPLSILRTMIDFLKKEENKSSMFAKRIEMKHAVFEMLQRTMKSGLIISPTSKNAEFVEYQMGRRRFESKVAAFTQDVLNQAKHRGVFINSFTESDFDNPVLQETLRNVATKRKKGGKLSDIMNFREAQDLIMQAIQNSESTKLNDTMIVQYFNETTNKLENYMLSLEAIYYSLKIEKPKYIYGKGKGITLRLDKNRINELIMAHLDKNINSFAIDALMNMPLENLIVQLDTVKKETELSGFRKRKELNPTAQARRFRS